MKEKDGGKEGFQGEDFFGSFISTKEVTTGKSLRNIAPNVNSRKWEERGEGDHGGEFLQKGLLLGCGD